MPEAPGPGSVLSEEGGSNRSATGRPNGLPRTVHRPETGSGATPMFDSPCSARRVKMRHFPWFDSLEDRIALSGNGSPGNTPPSALLASTTVDVGAQTEQGPLTVNLIDPAPNSVLAASPVSLLLQFNRPIFPDTVDNDVVVVQTDANGNPTSFTCPDSLTVDQSATQLTASLTEPLAPGHYQVWIVGTSSITDLDGNYLTDGTTNLVVGQFDVAVPGVGLADAVDLANPGSTPEQVAGALDFQTPSQAVSLYRIQLDPGHFWRLGLEVTPQTDSETLDTALALFDDQGQLVASDAVGLPDAPQDPYLFAGLQPGTYYVGVSGVGNLPGLPGGYDPATGSPGSLTQTQNGGPFTLYVVADPVATPPSVLGFTLDHADPADSAPTGFTLAFSRAIAVTAQFGDREPSLSNAVEVVDQAGQSWPVQVSNYSESDAKISYLFDTSLPPGHYLVKLPEQGGLTDLAGLSPVAAGQPPGVLGQFDVAGQQGEHNPMDLGSLLPAAAAAGVPINVSLSPGQSITYKVVVTVPGLYIFQEQSSGDPPSVQITGPALDRPLSPTGTNDTLLSPGIYSIQIEDPTHVPVQVHLFVRLSSDQTELVLANGVGQGPALSLRLITFSEVTGTTPPVSVTPSVFGPFLMSSPAATALGSTDYLAGSLVGPVLGNSEALRGIPITDTPAATTSYSGLGPGLIGRPSVAVYGSETLQQEAVAGTGPQSFQGAVLGQSLKAFPTGPARFLWESASSTGGDPADSVARPPAQATIISVDLRWAIATADGLRQWAIQQGEYFVSRTGFWSEERPTSEDTSILFPRLIPGLGLRQTGLEPQPSSEITAREPVRASAWTRLLSPPVVVMSVAAIAQVCWYYARWRKFRRHPEQEGITSIPTPSMGWDLLNVSLLIGSHPRAGSHDLGTVFRRSRSF
jgi:Bacterial Ig-like domain